MHPNEKPLALQTTCRFIHEISRTAGRTLWDMGIQKSMAYREASFEDAFDLIRNNGGVFYETTICKRNVGGFA